MNFPLEIPPSSRVSINEKSISRIAYHTNGRTRITEIFVLGSDPETPFLVLNEPEPEHAK